MATKASEFGGKPGLVQSEDDGHVLDPYEEYFLSRQGVSEE